VNLKNLLLIGGAAFLAYNFLIKPSAATSAGGNIPYVEQTSSPVSTPSKPTVKPDTIYKNKPSYTQNQFLAKLAASGEARAATTADPLIYQVTSQTGYTRYVSKGRPASEAEHLAARKANAEEVARLDPSYRNTISYQELMAQ